MSDLGTVLKQEIRRLARKELRAQLSLTKGQVAQHRRAIAALKRTLSAQERTIAALSQLVSRHERARPAAVTKRPDGVRYSARSVRSQRKRLGLSADDFGKLVGVSSQAIYNWEHKLAKPREQQFLAFLELRGLGRREVKRRLEALSDAPRQLKRAA